MCPVSRRASVPTASRSAPVKPASRALAGTRGGSTCATSRSGRFATVSSE
jgi:hypothetical protein